MSVLIYSCSQYIQSKELLVDRIEAIEQLIDVMFFKQLDATTNTDLNVQEYWLDDGQVKIKTQYRSLKEFHDGIHGLEVMKERLKNQLYGRKSVLRDVNSIIK